MAKVAEVLESIASLTVLEAAELKTMMEEKFGITAAAGVVMAAGAGAGGEAAAEKTEDRETERRVREKECVEGRERE